MTPPLKSYSKMINEQNNYIGSHTIILCFHPVGNDYNVFQACYMAQNQKKPTSNLTFQQARNYLLV